MTRVRLVIGINIDIFSSVQRHPFADHRLGFTERHGKGKRTTNGVTILRTRTGNRLGIIG